MQTTAMMSQRWLSLFRNRLQKDLRVHPSQRRSCIAPQLQQARATACSMSFQNLRAFSTSTPSLSPTCAGPTTASNSNSNSNSKLVVVGSGRMGHIRAQLIRASPKLELMGIVDTNLASAEALAETYHVSAFASLEEAYLASLVAIDGIICCSPTASHRQVVSDAVHAGTSIFVEKPVDESAEQIAHLFAMANAAQIQLCCGFQRRFDPSYQSALHQLPKIGTPIYANIFFGDHPVPSADFLITGGGGDIFMDLSAHDIDYVLQCVPDQSVVRVYATTGISSTPELRAAGIHDNATMILTLSGGTVVHLFLSRSATYGYDQRFELFGSQGRLQVRNIAETATVLSTEAGIVHSKYQYSFPQRFHHAFGLELEAFGDTLRKGGAAPWPVTERDCIRVQQVADAAQESARTGQVIAM